MAVNVLNKIAVNTYLIQTKITLDIYPKKL